MHGGTYLQSPLQGPDYKCAFSLTNTGSETCPVVGLINCEYVVWFDENMKTYKSVHFSCGRLPFGEGC